MRNREIRLLQQYTSGPAVGILIRCEPGTGRCSTHVHHAAPSVRRLENISLLPGLDRVRSSGFSRPEVRVWTWGFLIATSLKWAEQISTSESEAWKADLNAIWPICHEDGPQGAGIVSGLPTIQAQPQSKTLGRLEGPPPLFRLNRRLSVLWSASPGSALGGQQRTRTPGSISLTENSEIQPDPSPY